MREQKTPSHYPSQWVAWSTVGILTVTYMFSMLDRHILVLLIEPIKADLGLSDTQVSLLTGISFALMYTVMGIPLGRMADLWGRKYIVIVGVSCWSLMTFFSGFSRNMWQLFVARMGVGFGEAGLTAPAYAMVPDLFPPRRMGLALAVFSLGAAPTLLLGGGLVAFAEYLQSFSIPFLAELASWRLVLMIAGCLSLLMVIPLLWMPEPTRQPISHASTNDPQRLSTFSSVLRYMWKRKAFYGTYVAATSVLYLFAMGFVSWIPTYFIRVREWDLATIGVTLGALSLAPMIFGGLFAGWLSDKLFSRGQGTAPVMITLSVVPILLLLLMVIIYAESSSLQLSAYIVKMLAFSMTNALYPVVIQMATPPAIRSQVSAIVLFVLNLVGLGLGPTIIALITDYVFRDEMALGHSLAVAGTVAYFLAAWLLYMTLKPFGRQAKDIVGAPEETVPDKGVLTASFGD